MGWDEAGYLVPLGGVPGLHCLQRTAPRAGKELPCSPHTVPSAFNSGAKQYYSFNTVAPHSLHRTAFAIPLVREVHPLIRTMLGHVPLSLEF